MTEETRALILYRLERAREALEEASILLDTDHANTFVNRLYYACFYAVSGLLLTKGLSSAKHSGVRALFHQNFVRHDIVSRELGKIYEKLYRNRQKGDYADLVRFEVDEVSGWHAEAMTFVEVIEKIIGDGLGKKGDMRN